MSRKTNSVGLRINTLNKNYNNCWYSDYGFSYNYTQSLCIENSQKDAFKALRVLLPKMSYIGAYKKATLCCCYLDKNKLLGYKGSYAKGTKILKTPQKKENMWYKDIPKKSYQREHVESTKDIHNSSFNFTDTYSSKLLEMLFSNSRDKTLKSFNYKNSLVSSALKKGIYKYQAKVFEECTISAESTGFFSQNHALNLKEKKKDITTSNILDEDRKHLNLGQKIDANVLQQGFKTSGIGSLDPQSLNILKISGSRGALDRKSTAFLLDFYKRNFSPWAFTKEKKQNSIEFYKSSRTLYKNNVLHETSSKGFIPSFLEQKLFLKSSDIGKNYRFVLKGRSLYNNHKTSRDLETSLFRFLSFVKILGYIFCVFETSRQKIFGPSVFLEDSGDKPSFLSPFMALKGGFSMVQNQSQRLPNASVTAPKNPCFKEIKISKIPENLKSNNQQPEISKFLEEKKRERKSEITLFYKQKIPYCYVKNFVGGLSTFWGNPVSMFLYKSRNEKACSLFLADYISYFLQRKVLFRRITKMLNFSKKNPSGSYGSKNPNNILPFISKIKGCRISCSGRVGGRSKKAQRSRTEKFMWGETGLNVFSNKIDFAKTIAETRFGIVGIKVWICYK